MKEIQNEEINIFVENDMNIKVIFRFNESNSLIKIYDKNFEKIIRKSINKPKGDIYYNDIKDTEEISISSVSVSDIRPLAYFKNLKKLYLLSCQGVDNIKPISNLNKLESLVIRIASLNSMEPLAEMDLSNLEE